MSAPAAGGPWYPPIPSLGGLPVDRTKTEPKPAYYKLQFGDEVTGFSYYVRTLGIVVGRNCEKPVPPPAITSPPVPPIPPLDEYPAGPSHSTSPPLAPPESILDTPPVPSFDSPAFPPVSAPAPALEHARSSSAPIPSTALPSSLPQEDDQGTPSSVRAGSLHLPLDGEAALQGDSVEVKQERADHPPAKAESEPLPSSEVKPDLDAPLPPLDDLDILDYPPPPPPKDSAPKDHVDVDLGPLKSVSRNHAKIEYRPDLGTFCLEIYGRNGAWVDDRYYVRGSTVPLNQGSQIQIATRIFSFILPPSPTNSPSYNQHPYSSAHHPDAYEDLPYPYNLDPSQIGYNDFYEHGGPGPRTMAAAAGMVPPPFNAFRAEEGRGLGIDGMGSEWTGNGLSEEDENSWDEDEDEDRSSGEGSEDDGEDGEEGGESDLSSLSSESGREEEEEGAEASRPRKGGKAVTKKKARRKESMAESASVKDENGESATPPRKTGGKASTKGAGKQPAKSAKKVKSGKHAVEDAMEVIDEDTPDASVAGESIETPSKSKSKKTKGAAEESGAEDRPKKLSKKAQRAAERAQAQAEAAAAAAETAEIVPKVEAPPPAVPTLAAAMAEAPTPPAAATPVPQATPSVQPPRPQTGSVPPAVVPRPMSAAPSAPTPPGSVSRPSPQTVNSSATIPEIPRPFYLTELIETPGRPGHIVVNVPIPPSGAGPRPPPGPLIGLDGKPFIGPPPIKPTATFATIIHRALVNLPRGRGTLGEVCNWVAGEWEWFRLNIDAGWQNSIRHNLSLNKAFLKVPRIPEDDPESKGSVWIIDPEEGPLFEEKQRRDAEKNSSKGKSAEVKREKERQRAEERARKQREMAIEQAKANPHPVVAPRPMPMAPRPMPRPPTTAAQQPHPAAAAPAHPPPPPKPTLAPKTKITVSVTTLTPALRAKSVINANDSSGNPLPFVCDGSTLYLEQTTFGHLTTDIIDKLTLLGASGAVDVLAAWVSNKNKQQVAKQAQQAQQAKNGMNGKNGVPMRPNGNGNGISPTSVNKTVQPPAKAPVPAAGIKPTGGSAAPPKPTTTTTAATGKPLPGAAPPGASLTKVIGMIAEVANAKGDVNTVGPNASALLRYIRVVGVDIDLRVAERIWATGVVPPLPAKKPLSGNNNTAAKPPGPAAAAAKPNGLSAPPASAANASTPSPATLKRKLEETAQQGSASPAPVAAQPVSTGAGAVAGAAAVEGSEAKKAKLEAP